MLRGQKGELWRERRASAGVRPRAWPADGEGLAGRQEGLGFHPACRKQTGKPRRAVGLSVERKSPLAADLPDSLGVSQDALQ